MTIQKLHEYLGQNISIECSSEKLNTKFIFHVNVGNKRAIPHFTPNNNPFLARVMSTSYEDEDKPFVYIIWVNNIHEQKVENLCIRMMEYNFHDCEIISTERVDYPDSNVFIIDITTPHTINFPDIPHDIFEFEHLDSQIVTNFFGGM